jgi:hypothetical protein
MGFFNWVLSIIYKSMFLTGDSGLRRAHVLSKLAFTISLILVHVVYSEKSIAILPVLIVLGIAHAGLEWIIAVLSLIGLVGVYLASSAYLLSLTGLYYMAPLQILTIALRATTVAMSIILLFNIISPIELYNLLHVLRARHFSTYTLLLWRLMPLGLKNFTDSLAVGYLKKETTVKRIPPATASIIESGWFIEEYNYWRLRVSSKTHIPVTRTIIHTIILLLSSLTILLIVKII